ncbi:extensin family protein [Hansschlegelia sp. KR7-227]|uniref:extensin-like domain-containing protein n=1 Tax=Hansschlegelia sp. KR7-227 TaxID=3400914 RepID=UPI003C04793B
MTAAIVLSDLDRWLPLDLRAPPGVFTQWRIRMLGAAPEACAAVLRRSAVAATPIPARAAAAGCGFSDGVTVSGVALGATSPVMRCPLAAAFVVWERHVVQPAARRRLGRPVARVEHLGTYACRDVAGRSGRRSQHATANAIDVSGFALAGGGAVSILADWRGDGAEARFLREVRDGACGLFAGVLSPDYDAAHRDHLHLDLGRFDSCR